MKIKFLTMFFIIVGLLYNNLIIYSQIKHYDTNSVIITRYLTRDLFNLNSVPYMDPLVTSVNATSNSRFYRQAFVPKKVNKPYFRFGLHGMMGFVRDDQKLYNPSLPTIKEPINNVLGNYIKNGVVDTLGLAVALIERLLQKGIDSGKIAVPEKAATIFGFKDVSINIDKNYLADLLQKDPEFALYRTLLKPQTQQIIDSAVRKLPGFLTIPPGQNFSRLYAFIPQLEVGAIYGTELMLRYIPPIQLDTSIGKFSFHGVALKHSISQYFESPSFDCAIQVGYQGTSLSNTVGVTNSQLKSDASFWNVNIHASKHFENFCDVYTGFNYEYVHIDASFSYVLSQQVQIMLGLLGVASDDKTVIYDPANGYPGDNVVQTSSAVYTDNNVKWTFGAAKQIGPIAIFLDYSVSKFNILSGGLEYRF